MGLEPIIEVFQYEFSLAEVEIVNFNNVDLATESLYK